MNPRYFLRWLCAAMVCIASAGCTDTHPAPSPATVAPADRASSIQVVQDTSSQRSPRTATAAADESYPSFGFKAPEQHVHYTPDGLIGLVIYEAVASGDFNGDGKSDLVFLADQDNSVDVMLQARDGSFETPILYWWKPGATTYSNQDRLALGDFNEDDITDILVDTASDAGAQEGIGLLLSRYGQPPVLHEALAPWAAMGKDIADDWAVMDADHDGHLDVVVVRSFADFSDATLGCSDGYLSVLCPHYEILRGDGRGNFTRGNRVRFHASDWTDGLGIRSVTVEDVTLDGRPDLVISVPYYTDGSRAFVAEGRKEGGFRAPRLLFESSGQDFVQFADINGDHLRDAVVGRDILLRNADGTFGAGRILDGYIPDPITPILHDFNRDGFTDYVQHQRVVSGSPPFLAVYLGEGTTLYTPFAVYHPWYSGTFAIPPHRSALAAGDFNSDGCQDLAVAIQYDGAAIFDGYNCEEPRGVKTGGPLPPMVQQ